MSEEKNRKMLEELQRQKRQLLMKNARQEEELEKQKKGPPPPMGRDQNQNKQTRVKTYKPPQLAVKPIRKSKSAHSSIANRPSLSMPSTSVGGISGADGKDTTAGSSTPSTSSTSTNPLGSYFSTKSATTMVRVSGL
jgi:hypothetical protein